MAYELNVVGKSNFKSKKGDSYSKLFCTKEQNGVNGLATEELFGAAEMFADVSVGDMVVPNYRPGSKGGCYLVGVDIVA